MLYLSILCSLFFVKGTLLVQVENLESDDGCLRIAFFNSEKSFLKDEQAVLATEYYFKGTKGVQMRFEDITFSTYAIAIYHDQNNNGKLDKNRLGIPKEPYAFSNNARAKWRSPKFKEAKFSFQKKEQKIKLELHRWSKN